MIGIDYGQTRLAQRLVIDMGQEPGPSADYRA
jgi:hypothetical protein